MAAIFATTFPFFALVLCGYVAVRRGWLPQAAIPGMNAFVLFFGLPCLLFRFGASTPVSQMADPGLFVLYLLCALQTVALSVAIDRRRGVGWNDAAFGALVAAFPNTGFMGVPLLVALLGARASGPLIVSLVVDLVITSSLCIALSRRGQGAAREPAQGTVQETAPGTVPGTAPGTAEGSAHGTLQETARGTAQEMARGTSQGWTQGTAQETARGLSQEMVQGAGEGTAQDIAFGTAQGAGEGTAQDIAFGTAQEAGQPSRPGTRQGGAQGSVAAARAALLAVARNPLPWAIVLGALASAFGLTLAAPVMKSVGMLADAASPVALFTIGAVLARAQMAASGQGWGQAVPGTLIKLLVQPVLVFAWGAAAIQAGLPLDPAGWTVLVLVACLPSANNVAMLAERYGADAGRVARVTLASTALSFISFSTAVALLV